MQLAGRTVPCKNTQKCTQTKKWSHRAPRVVVGVHIRIVRYRQKRFWIVLGAVSSSEMSVSSVKQVYPSRFLCSHKSWPKTYALKTLHHIVGEMQKICSIQFQLSTFSRLMCHKNIPRFIFFPLEDTDYHAGTFNMPTSYHQYL